MALPPELERELRRDLIAAIQCGGTGDGEGLRMIMETTASRGWVEGALAGMLYAVLDKHGELQRVIESELAA